MSSSSNVEHQDSFLKLPASYGVAVEDVVSFSLDTEGKSKTLSEIPRPSTGPGNVLVAKVCHALADRGYLDADVVRKVGVLTAQNLLTCYSAQVAGHGVPDGGILKTTENENVNATIEAMLMGLLDKRILRSRNVNVNSNEPVLLMSQPAGMDVVLFRTAVDEAVRQLQSDWHISPVRVFAGPYAQSIVDRGFSITLLNVVNTDIGGPNMVELLDSPCDAPGWTLNGVVKRQQWRDGSLLGDYDGLKHSNEDRRGEPDETDDDGASEHSIDSVNDSVDSQPFTSASLEGQGRRTASSPQGQMVEEAAPSGPEPKSGVSERGLPGFQDEPAEVKTKLAEQSELESIQSPPEQSIEHPTWDRREHDKMSLLDLIRSQASMLAPFGTSDEPEEKSEKALLEASPDGANSGADDEFVVVGE